MGSAKRAGLLSHGQLWVITQACLTEYGLAQVEQFLVKVILGQPLGEEIAPQSLAQAHRTTKPDIA
jgi:hypothetical protein